MPVKKIVVDKLKEGEIKVVAGKIEIPAEMFAEIDRIRRFTDELGVDHPPIDINGNVPISFEHDSVGIAKETTLSELNTKIITCDTDNVSITSTVGLKPSDLNIDLEKDLQVDVKTMPPISVTPTARTLHSSTTTPLGANETYTSVSVEVLTYNKITGTCFADQSGTLVIEQSPDGANWDYESSWTYTANAKFGFSVELISRYARIKFINGSVAQTVFRLYAYLG